MSTGLVWYRKDLRTIDHEALKLCCEQHDNVYALYCFDPRHYALSDFGFKKTGKYRAQFLIETIQELRSNLATLNIPLFIFQERPEHSIPDLIKKFNISDVYFQKEWTSEEMEVENKLVNSTKNVNFHSFFQQFLYHPEDISYQSIQKIPGVFTDFRKVIEKSSEVRNVINVPSPKTEQNLDVATNPVPTLNELGLEHFERDPRSAFPFSGGENKAMDRLHHYFWETKNLLAYKETRNGLIGSDYSSKLSAWLANGSISPRQVYHKVKEFEKDFESNQSTYWLLFELLWRDYFKYVSMKHGDKIFKIGGILDKNYEWKQDSKIIQDWVHGNTAEPFINANMKEIALTGFMSNRGRQNVNSYLAKELNQDWRMGAAYFEQQLIDYDVHSNWCNWMYNSGVGNDPRNRKFNIKQQAEYYDPEGNYQQLWLKN